MVAPPKHLATNVTFFATNSCPFAERKATVSSAQLLTRATGLQIEKPMKPYRGLRTAIALLLWTASAPAALADALDRPSILRRMEEVMGPLPSDERKVPLDVQFTEETKLEGYMRKKQSFASEKGDRVPAYLLIPTDRKSVV